MTCACGHVQDEHEEPTAKKAASPCLIDGCDCIAFDWDGNEEDE